MYNKAQLLAIHTVTGKRGSCWSRTCVSPALICYFRLTHRRMSCMAVHVGATFSLWFVDLTAAPAPHMLDIPAIVSQEALPPMAMQPKPPKREGTQDARAGARLPDVTAFG